MDAGTREEERLLKAAFPIGRPDGMKGHLHDLIVAALETGCRRGKFISRMLEAGGAIHKVRDWAGHRNIATTGIYANTTLPQLEDARKAFEAHEPNGPRATPATSRRSELTFFRFSWLDRRLRRKQRIVDM